LGPTQPPV